MSKAENLLGYWLQWKSFQFPTSRSVREARSTSQDNFSRYTAGMSLSLMVIKKLQAHTSKEETIPLKKANVVYRIYAPVSRSIFASN